MTHPLERGRGERAGAWIDNAIRAHGSEFISAGSLAATVVASLPGVFMGPLPWVGIGVALAITAGVVRTRGSDSIAGLRAERDEAKERAVESVKALRDAVSPLAFNLSEYLELFESHQRLSVYCHYEGEFRLLARVAKNPHFQSRGRLSYPESQGVIGTVWRDGDAFERVGRQESWEDWVARFGFSPEDAQTLRMKSNIIAAVRLDYQRTPVGVVLLESESPRGITGDHFEKLQKSYITRSLGELLAIAGPLIPGSDEN